MSTNTFEALMLPEEMRLDLCRSVLAEAGVERVSINPVRKEIIHRCAMPFHEDRSPSASLNYESLTYKCLGCTSSGGFLWLLRTIRGGSHEDARSWVVDQSGLGGGDFDLGMMLRYIDALYEQKPTGKTRTLTRYSPRALDPWAFIHPWLTDPPEEGGRGIPEENVVRMQVGYAQEYPMGKRGDDTLRPPSERIVVPHFWEGSLVGWQSRRIADDGTPKWLSTPEMPIEYTLYGDPKALEGHDYVVVVESPMTVLRHVHHLPILATFGADVTDYQVRLICGMDRKVIWWPDPDEAGWRSLEGHGSGLSRSPGIIERVMHRDPPGGLWTVSADWAVDGADMDEETARDLVENAEPALLWERPSALRCWDCKMVHEGDCAEGGVDDGLHQTRRR